MRVLIVGGGLTGSELARLLLQEGQQVTVIEEREEVLAKLQKEVPQANLVLGDGCEPSILEQAGVRKMDVVAAVTGHDEDNLVVCLLAKQLNHLNPADGLGKSGVHLGGFDAQGSIGLSGRSGKYIGGIKHEREDEMDRQCQPPVDIKKDNHDAQQQKKVF